MPLSARDAAVRHIEELARKLTEQSNLLQSHIKTIQERLVLQHTQMEECRLDLDQSKERYQQMEGFLVEIFEELADLAEVDTCLLTDPVVFAKIVSLFDDEQQARYEEYREEMREIRDDMQHERVLQQKIHKLLHDMQQDRRRMQVSHAMARRKLHHINHKQRMVLLAAMHSGLVKLVRKKELL